MSKYFNIVLDKLFFTKPKWTFLKRRNFLIHFKNSAKKGFRVLNLDVYKSLSFNIEQNPNSSADSDLLFKLCVSTIDLNDKSEDFDIGFFETRAEAEAALRKIKNGAYSASLSSIKALLFAVVFSSLAIFLVNMVINFTQPSPPPQNFGQLSSGLPQIPNNIGAASGIDQATMQEYERQMNEAYQKMQQGGTQMPSQQQPQQAQQQSAPTTPSNDLMNAMGN